MQPTIQYHGRRSFSSLQFLFPPGKELYHKRGKAAQERPKQRQQTWSGGGMMLWHNNAKGYICPGAAECSASLLRLSSEEASKGA